MTNSVIAVKSHMENARQIIRTSGTTGDADKAQLDQLMQKLSELLEKASPEQKEDAGAIADAAGDLASKATKEQPNKRSV